MTQYFRANGRLVSTEKTNKLLRSAHSWKSVKSIGSTPRAFTVHEVCSVLHDDDDDDGLDLRWPLNHSVLCFKAKVVLLSPLRLSILNTLVLI